MSTFSPGHSLDLPTLEFGIMLRDEARLAVRSSHCVREIVYVGHMTDRNWH
ncbi:MAG: hypothetical protein ACYSWX_12450 [Planctomycetota bacterium]